MPLAPSTSNYLYGKGHLLFKPSGETGFLHLGNCPDFGVTVEITKEDHYSSMSGTKEKDKTIVSEKSAKSTLSLEEFSAQNINLAFMGDGVNVASQLAAAVDAAVETLVSDRFTELGHYGVFVTKVNHGTVTDGPFVAGETVTGGTSAATGEVAWADASGLYVELINVSGTFVAGETITGGTSAASATTTSVAVTEDVVVTDAATPTTRYVQGTDYSLVAAGGLIREISGGSIASHTAYLSYDRPAQTLNSIDALVNSSVEGQLLFIGNADDGPKWKIEGWNVSLTVTGEAKFISESVASIPMEAEYLSDNSGHPNNPFFLATEIG